MKLDHVAIAVDDLKSVVSVFKEILGQEPEMITDDGRGLNIAIFKLENVKLEFMEPIREDSPISKFLKRKGNGIHHIAIRVDDVEEYARKFPTIGNIEKGLTANRIVFLDIHFTHKILTEIVSD